MDLQLAETVDRSLKRTHAALEDLQLLDTTAAAAVLGEVSPKTLVTWRHTKRYNLPFVKIGRKVFYDVRDLLRFVEERKVHKVEPVRRSRRRTPAWKR
jgi:hypothetical protein